MTDGHDVAFYLMQKSGVLKRASSEHTLIVARVKPSLYSYSKYQLDCERGRIMRSIYRIKRLAISSNCQFR